MKNDNGKVAKATLWYTISNILLRGVSVFTAPIFTRLLSTSDYGIASNFSSWMGIVLCFTDLSLSTAVIRGKVEFQNDFKSYLSSIQTLGIIWTIICAIFFLIGIDFWSDFMHIDKICIVAMLFYLVVYPSLGYAQIDYRFDYRYKENVAISIINTLGTVICSIGLILFWTDQRYLGRIIGMLIPTMFMGTYFAVRIFRNGKTLLNKEYWKYALKISLPLIPHGLAMIVLGQIDRVMIMKYCGESAAGIYSFGYSYAVLSAVVTNAINDAVQPQMYEMLKNKQEKSMAKMTYKLMVFGILITVLLIGAGPEALKILGTEDYYSAKWIIFPVAVGTFMQYLYQFFGVIEIYCKKTVYMAIGSCGAAVVNFILNMIFIPRYGYIAASYTTLMSYFLLMLFHFVITKIIYNKKIYSFGHIIIISFIAVFMGILLSLIYTANILIRYIVFVFIICIMVFYLRNEIKMILNKFIRKVEDK